MKEAILTHAKIDELIQSDSKNLFRDVLAIIEKPVIESVLIRCRGNQTAAAEILGLNRGTMRQKMKKLGMLK
ncbi:hypothetical protein GCM10023206_07470 [Acinetobacter puyangensis]|uniref:Fis family transcriptional regulator, factor for inversion stimulation protein n=1 Tax=Acinetobacter puyangensis TaxID=1096779 RepID=A0A240E7F5_9GAMM|nr:helix-turn-helix domain-containing protein [Acinetobacter puyangensis]SNX44173.1 Fis family transcriptional regulator, factor for inversion stimulation protein [Acinetobacter puyangensis]